MDISSEIISYITSNETLGALLITGAWGSGKTYTVKKILSECRTDHDIIPITVSLFGIDSLSHLDYNIKNHLLFEQLGKDYNQSTPSGIYSIFKHFLSFFANKITEKSPIFNSINAILSINPADFIEVKQKVDVHTANENGACIIPKKLILVFDDFERCKINTIDLLGKINDYCENKEIKVIIIADEAHIEDPYYKEFKEKVISRTVKIEQQYHNILQSIIAQYKETSPDYGEFLELNVHILERVFIESKSDNLRTFKALLYDFERIYQAWIKAEIPTDRIDSVLYTFGAIFYESKANAINDNPDEEYGRVSIHMEKYPDFDPIFYIKPLLDWAIKGIWDENYLVNSIRQIVAPYKVDELTQFLYTNFWDLNDEIISSGLTKALYYAYRGELNRDQLISVLNTLSFFIFYNIVPKVEINYERMYDGYQIRKAKIKNGDIEEPECSRFLMSNAIQRLPTPAQELYNDIAKSLDIIDLWDNRLKLIKYLKNPDRYTRASLNNNYVLISFDSELCDIFFDTFCNAENYNKRELFLTLNRYIFNNPMSSGTKEIEESRQSFITLKLRLEKYLDTISDSITTCIVKESIKQIDSKIEELQETL